MLNREVSTQAMQAREVLRQKQEFNTAPEFIKRRAVKGLSTTHTDVVVKSPSKFNGLAKKVLAGVATVAGVFMVVDNAILDYTTVEAAINWYGNNKDAYVSVYDAVKQMNPHANEHTISKLVYEFKSINGLHDYYDYKDIKAGTYMIPVLK